MGQGRASSRCQLICSLADHSRDLLSRTGHGEPNRVPVSRIRIALFFHALFPLQRSTRLRHSDAAFCPSSVLSNEWQRLAPFAGEPLPPRHRNESCYGRAYYCIMQEFEYDRAAGKCELLPSFRRIRLSTVSDVLHLVRSLSPLANRMGSISSRSSSIPSASTSKQTQGRVAAFIHPVIKHTSMPADGISLPCCLRVCLTRHCILIIA